jgi:adenosylhomocysteine nucleosidase
MLPPRMLFAFALEREAKPFRRRCPAAWVLVTGAGRDQASRAITKAISSVRPDAIVIAGFAGALVDELKVGDVVEVTEAVEENGELSVLSPLSRLCGRGVGGEGLRWASQKPLAPHTSAANPPEGDQTSPIFVRLLTAARIIGTPDLKRAAAIPFRASVVDMETAAIARICNEHAIPCAAVRVISDSVDTTLSPELINLLSGGDVSIRRTLAAVLRQPSLLAEFRRLARDTRIAAERLADYLCNIIQPQN